MTARAPRLEPEMPVGRSALGSTEGVHPAKDAHPPAISAAIRPTVLRTAWGSTDGVQLPVAHPPAISAAFRLLSARRTALGSTEGCNYVLHTQRSPPRSAHRVGDQPRDQPLPSLPARYSEHPEGVLEHTAGQVGEGRSPQRSANVSPHGDQLRDQPTGCNYVLHTCRRSPP